MDLIDDLGTDLAMAILVDQKHLDRLNRTEAMRLIGRVRNELIRLSGEHLKDRSTREPKEQSAEC